MTQRIVVLGGAGLIGTHLCLRLLGEGNEVFCVDLRDSSSSPLLQEVLRHSSFRYIRHDIVDPFAIRCDRIYNLTAPSPLDLDRTLPVDTLKINILGSMNALETARSEHARILFASSGEVYTSCYRENAGEEQNIRSLHHLLAEGKRSAESLHRAFNAQYGIETRIARIFNTYGTGCDPTDQRVVMKMVTAALGNRDLVIYGSGEQRRTFCWVEDIVDGLILLMETRSGSVTKTVNLGSDHEITIRALAEKIIDLTGSRSHIVHLQARADDPRRRTPDLTTARRELGWSPRTPLVEGLRRTISYAEKILANKSYAAMSWVEVH